MNTCNVGFQTENKKECFYYRKGSCLRGDSCRFQHNDQNYQPSVPECRNGRFCRYLSSGVCSFFHAGVGVQKPKQEYINPGEQVQEGSTIKSSSWCLFLEDCNRVPNCPYIHSNQDFPKLTKQNSPPILSRRTMNGWEDY